MTVFTDRPLRILIPFFSLSLLVNGCTSLSDAPSFSRIYADLKSSGFSDSTLEGSVNALITWDYADELSVNVASACSSSKTGAECSRYVREATAFLVTLENRCQERHDGLSCGKGAMLATHLQKKTSFYDSSDNGFFSSYFIKMVKKGCELNDAASCDDYGYQFLSRSDKLSLINHHETGGESSSLKYFEKACSLGNVTSCERLSALYGTGKLLSFSVKPDKNLSDYYLQQACALNSAEMIEPSRCTAVSKSKKD